MYVEEKDRAWTSSNADNDHQAVTIEVANDKIGGDWHVSDKALASLIDLCVDICKRNGIKKLNYTGDKNGNLTRHNMFAATACPGPYLQSKFPYIANEVNKRLTAKPEPKPAPPKGVDEMAAYVTVKQGDSMYAIAKAKGKKLADLQKYNPHVTDPSLIHVGDIIYLSAPNQTEIDYATLKRKFVTMQTVDGELYEKQLADKDKEIKALSEDIRLLKESMKVINGEAKRYV
jgi:LysM repeat protein